MDLFSHVFQKLLSGGTFIWHSRESIDDILLSKNKEQFNSNWILLDPCNTKYDHFLNLFSEILRVCETKIC